MTPAFVDAVSEAIEVHGSLKSVDELLVKYSLEDSEAKLLKHEFETSGRFVECIQLIAANITEVSWESRNHLNTVLAKRESTYEGRVAIPVTGS
jgi:hypothetical protein